MEQQTYKRFKVLGISDRSECDQCGKTNLRLTIVLESEGGEVLHYGSDCAARSLKQRYMGKRYPVSREAALSMARRAKSEAVTLEAA
jgi:hypothetical protein